MSNRLSCRSLPLVLSALALAACGGGGSSNTPPPGTYSVGGTVSNLVTGQSVTLANNGGDALTVNASGNFTFKTFIADGAGYAVTVTTQPAGQDCTVTNGMGSSMSANVSNVSVSCANLPEYAYVVNNGANTISQYAVSANGTLVPLGTPIVATGSSPQSVTINPTRKFVYVTNLLDNTVSQYAIRTDGTLMPDSPATVATGARPDALAFDASGTFAYVVNSGDSNVTQFSIDALGRLTRTAAAPTATGSNPWNLVFTPDGKYAYASNFGTGVVLGTSIQQLAVAASGGGLSALNPASVATGPRPSGSAIDSASANLYLAGFGSDDVAQFTISSSGQLTLAADVSLPTSSAPVYVALRQGGKNAYVVNYSSVAMATAGTISQFSIGMGGALSTLTNPSVATGIAPLWLAFDGRGQYAYVVNSGDGTVGEYSIGADGSLTSIGTVNGGNAPFAVALAY